jgi:hypothetical protein
MNIQLNNKFRVLVVGVVLPSMGSSQASTLYVAPSSAKPMPPYTNWATAAPTIQQAIDAAAPSDVIIVTNGIYATGGRVVPDDLSATNRITVDKPLTVRSVNGSQSTVIQGDEFTRCAYLASGVTLSGFTLTNGHVLGDLGGEGAGVLCESETAVVSDCLIVSNSALNYVTGRGGGASGGTLNRCTLVGNSAYYDFFDGGGGAYSCTLNDCVLVGNSAASGGGAAGSTLNNCALVGNSAPYGSGGGASDSTLNNCTLVRNSASDAFGGADQCRLSNCIVYYNSAPYVTDYPNYDPFATTCQYCCTTPASTNGFGNITNAPLFVDLAAGDLRLRSDSPCINAGNNAYAPDGPDLDGSLRIAGGTVDIGAYEFPTPASVISCAWLQYFGLPTDGSADFIDSDGDGMNNWQEWISWTNPTNALSVLKMTVLARRSAGISVTWQSVGGVVYSLERSTNLAAQPAFSLLQTNLAGQADMMTYLDTNAIGPGPFFYRVGVK